MPLNAHPLLHHLYTITRLLLRNIVTLLWCICGLPIFVPFVFIFLLFSAIIYSSRVICNRVSEHHKTTRLTPEECALLNKVGSNAVVQCLIFLNAPIVLNRLHEKIEGVLSGRSAAGMLDNLTRRLILDEQPLWDEIDSFDISKYVHENTNGFDSIEEVENFVDQCSCEGFDLTNALWEIRSCTFKQEGFLLLRFHPCVISGKTAVTVLCNSLADNTCDYTSPHRFPGNQTWRSALDIIIKLPFYLLKTWHYQSKEKQCRKTFFSIDRNFNRICKDRKRHAWSEKIHLPSLMHTAAVLRTSLSVVSLSALASSIRLISNNFNDVNMFPVKLLYDFNNSSSSSRGSPPSYREANITAPCNIEGAVPCLWEIRQTIMSLKQNPFPYLTSLTLRMLTFFSSHNLPLKFLSSLMKKRALCVFTSLSGSTATLYICGRRVQNVCMWYPVTPGVIISSSLMTYADECRICVELWENCGIDPRQLVQECQRQIEILIEQMKNRQLPGKKKSVFHDDADLDELELNYEELQDKNTAAQTSKPISRLFFERSKVVSISNGLAGDCNLSSMSSETEIEGGIDNFQIDKNPPVSQCIPVYIKDTDQFACRVSNDTGSHHSLMADLEVGIEISPAVERRYSAAFL